MLSTKVYFTKTCSLYLVKQKNVTHVCLRNKLKDSVQMYALVKDTVSQCEISFRENQASFCAISIFFKLCNKMDLRCNLFEKISIRQLKRTRRAFPEMCEE